MKKALLARVAALSLLAAGGRRAQVAMIDTPTSAGAEINRLGLPAVFGAIMDGTLAENQTVPVYIRRELRCPHSYFELCHDLVRHVPGLAGFCPLWEQNSEAVIGRLADGRFVRFYYEDASLENPGAAIEVLGKNYQQFVTSTCWNLRTLVCSMSTPNGWPINWTTNIWQP